MTTARERWAGTWRGALSLAVLLLGAGPSPAGEGFARALPTFTLRDPAGHEHTHAALCAAGLVLVVTAPTFASEDEQRGWDELLRAAHPRTGPVAAARLVFVEDLDASWVPGLALSGMREEYRAGQEPVVLIDERGALRRALGAEADTTVVLVYDARGVLVHEETGDPGRAAAARAWSALAPTVARR